MSPFQSSTCLPTCTNIVNMIAFKGAEYDEGAFFPDAGVRVKPLMTLPAINTDASKYGKEQISSIVQEMLVSQHFGIAGVVN